MKFISIILTGLVAVLPLAQAEDFRLLVSYSPKRYHNSTVFCTEWTKEW